MRPIPLLLALAVPFALAALLPLPGARAVDEEKVTELHPNGKPKLVYTVDDTGRRDGNCQEFYPGGRIKIRSRYKSGKLHGMVTEFHESGRPKLSSTYRDGELNGPYKLSDEKGKTLLTAEYTDGEIHGKYVVFRDGEPASDQRWKKGVLETVDGVVPYPKTRAAILEAVEDVFNTRDPLEDKTSDKKATERGEALRVLRIYRYLCDVPHDGMHLEQGMNDHADAGAALCERIGRLDHTPANPGMPEKEYQFGYYGTSHSNLHRGGDMVDSVHAYMDDSDPSNIDRVGHRRWCINPRMKKVGFGSSGLFTAMMAHDNSRGKLPDIDYVAYPPRGWMPVYYFGPRHAWSVSLAAGKFSKPDPAKLKVSVFALDQDFVRAAEPIPLDYMGFNDAGMGMPWCIIFRPATLAVEDGARYWVRIDGLQSGGQAGPLEYMVEFFEL